MCLARLIAALKMKKDHPILSDLIFSFIRLLIVILHIHFKIFLQFELEILGNEKAADTDDYLIYKVC